MHGSLGSTLSPIARQQAGKSRPPAMALASVVSGLTGPNEENDPLT